MGELTAIWMNYACHCTTMGPRNHIGGDWAGYANDRVEAHFEGAVALTTIGCGADIGPQPSGDLKLALRHGQSIADEVNDLIESRLTPLTEKPVGQMRTLALPLESIPSRDHWLKQSRKDGFHGAHARRLLAMLDRDGTLSDEVPLPVSAWTFGRELAIIFLAGEVVVDYAVRLKHELDWTRLWINGWSHDVPGYIPSQRVLAEGGYEADYSMIYYGKPTRFDPAVEEVIVHHVKQLLGPAFVAPSDRSPPDFLRYPPNRAQRVERKDSLFSLARRGVFPHP